jgi:hypothetical protein
MPWESKSMDLLATRVDWVAGGRRGGIIKTKDQILVNMKHEEHVSFVQQRLPPLITPPRKRIRLPRPQPLLDLDSQLYRVLSSTHHLLSSTNPTLAEDWWLSLSPSLLQVLDTPMDSLEISPSNKLDLPLARLDITNVKLTYLAPQSPKVIGVNSIGGNS